MRLSIYVGLLSILSSGLVYAAAEPIPSTVITTDGIRCTDLYSLDFITVPKERNSYYCPVVISKRSSDDNPHLPPASFNTKTASIASILFAARHLTCYAGFVGGSSVEVVNTLVDEIVTLGADIFTQEHETWKQVIKRSVQEKNLKLNIQARNAVIDLLYMKIYGHEDALCSSHGPNPFVPIIVPGAYQHLSIEARSKHLDGSPQEVLSALKKLAAHTCEKEAQRGNKETMELPVLVRMCDVISL